MLAPTDPITVISDISPLVRSHLRGYTEDGIIELLAQATIISSNTCCAMVLQIDEELVVKITSEKDLALTESQSLAFLQEKLPTFQVPKPHGLVVLGSFSLLFTSLVPGIPLDRAWGLFDSTQKAACRDQLDQMLSQLRSLKLPADAPFGGVEGGACRDIRRDRRDSTSPIYSTRDFEDFIFSGSTSASTTYIKVLRDLLPEKETSAVFTHGDVRPANIMVDKAEDTWCITGIIDWETSGFYPDWWECVKMTNNLKPSEPSDWYNYLPRSVGPQAFPVHWLADRVWDLCMSNR